LDQTLGRYGVEPGQQRPAACLDFGGSQILVDRDLDLLGGVGDIVVAEDSCRPGPSVTFSSSCEPWTSAFSNETCPRNPCLTEGVHFIGGLRPLIETA
jgi:hypothetical protein